MTDATLKILIDGLVPAAGALAAITAAIGAVAALRRQNVADSKLNDLKEETGKIHTLTNSTASELQKSYQVLIEKSSGQDREIAALKADKLERKEDTIRAESSAVAAALALPPNDEKIVNGDPKIDSIKETGEDTNRGVGQVKIQLGDRVEKVEEKLDAKKDK